jgi:hypothetical protein
MADRLVKIVGKHAPDCFAVKNSKSGFWPTHWGPIAYGGHGSPVVRTERRYGKNGSKSRYWLRFVCNDTTCTAELHVEQQFILDAAERACSAPKGEQP